MFNEQIRGLPIIAVLRGITYNEAIPVGEVLTREGIVIIEVTLNSPTPYKSIQILSRMFGTDKLIGAGTVTTIDQLRQVKQAGGRLIVSPHTDVDLICAAKAEDMIVVPGCFSPTEILAAIKAGADAIKLFPAEIIPPVAMRAMRGVLPPSIEMFATGGIDANNIACYLRSGVNGFGIGSSLYKPGKSLVAIETDARSIVEAFVQTQNWMKMNKQ